jgi:hypothetical protein
MTAIKFKQQNSMQEHKMGAAIVTLASNKGNQQLRDHWCCISTCHKMAHMMHLQVTSIKRAIPLHVF